MTVGVEKLKGELFLQDKIKALGWILTFDELMNDF